MTFSLFRFFAPMGVALLPVAARAECLGDGCYDGLGAVLLGFAAAAIAFLVAVAFVAYKLGRRFGVLAAVAFVAVALGVGYSAVSGFL